MAAPLSVERSVPATPPVLGSDRSALIITTLFLFSVLSVPKFDLASVLVFGAFPAFLIGMANISAAVIMKRLLQLSPFVLFMALGNISLDRTPMLSLSGFTITGGMMSAIVIVAKTMVSVAGMLSVTLCIPFYRICRALEALHVPEVLITQLMLLDRYRSLLHEEALSMQKARDTRSFGKKGKELFRTASLIGSLLLRTTSRAEKIYRSMNARGFQMQRKARPAQKMALREWLTIALWVLLFFSLRLIF
ncbi:MAG: cobalt ABC transporter [Chlorobium sp.]|nr:MAG: cobalt ABC transporter [Chlorobium sp.]